ncbi:hypothetical protein [Neptuniibacter sp. QD37_11]
MPTWKLYGNWQEKITQREAYRQKLIDKGVVDGGSKMRKLMSKKGF